MFSPSSWQHVISPKFLRYCATVSTSISWILFSLCKPVLPFQLRWTIVSQCELQAVTSAAGASTESKGHRAKAMSSGFVALFWLFKSTEPNAQSQLKRGCWFPALRKYTSQKITSEGVLDVEFLPTVVTHYTTAHWVIYLWQISRTSPFRNCFQKLPHSVSSSLDKL